MIVVDGQKSYQGAYAERIQNRHTTNQMTEAKKGKTIWTENLKKPAAVKRSRNL